MPILPQLSHDPVVSQLVPLFTEARISAWLVGSYLRDRLLGRPASTLEIAIKVPEPVAMVCASQIAVILGGRFVPAEANDMVGRVRFESAQGAETHIAIAPLYGSDITADLCRRGFTVNALAIDLGNWRLIDPSNGYEDLNRARIRVIGDTSFAARPLRLLRAVRLAVTLGFTIDQDTRTLMYRDAHLLAELAPEQIHMEFVSLLRHEPAVQHVALLDDSGLLGYVLPELTACQAIQQPAEHTLDVYGHTLAVLSALEQVWPWTTNAKNVIGQSFWQPPLARYRAPLARYLRGEIAPGQPRWLLLKLAALLHDVGKPATRSVDAHGDIHFYDHARVGAHVARHRLCTLGFSKPSIEWITTIVRQHLRPLRLSTTADNNQEQLRHFLCDAGDAAAALALHSTADQLGKGGTVIPPAVRHVVDAIWTACLTQ